MQKEERLTVKLTAKQKERVKRLADDKEMTMSGYIVYLLNKEERKVTN